VAEIAQCSRPEAAGSPDPERAQPVVLANRLLMGRWQRRLVRRLYGRGGARNHPAVYRANTPRADRGCSRLQPEPVALSRHDPSYGLQRAALLPERRLKSSCPTRPPYLVGSSAGRPGEAEPSAAASRVSYAA
jgi:hypothetical protein